MLQNIKLKLVDFEVISDIFCMSFEVVIAIIVNRQGINVFHCLTPKMKTLKSFATLGTTCLATQYHFSEELYVSVRFVDVDLC